MILNYKTKNVLIFCFFLNILCFVKNVGDGIIMMVSFLIDHFTNVSDVSLKKSENPFYTLKIVFPKQFLNFKISFFYINWI